LQKWLVGEQKAGSLPLFLADR